MKYNDTASYSRIPEPVPMKKFDVVHEGMGIPEKFKSKKSTKSTKSTKLTEFMKLINRIYSKSDYDVALPVKNEIPPQPPLKFDDDEEEDYGE